MRKPAFIFDLDGVITDTAIHHFHAWRRLAESLGIEFTEQDNEQLKGVDRKGSLEYILRRTKTPYSDAEKNLLMEHKNKDYLRSISRMTPDDMLEGVEPLLHSLREAGHPIGLASASRNALTVLDGLKLREMFDYVADAGQIANGKPAPDIFLDVMNHFELKPEECIGIEDAAAGVTAIKAAGMVAIGIGEAEVLKEADMVLPAIKELTLDMALTLWQDKAQAA